MKIGIVGDTHVGSGYNFGKTDGATQLNTRLLDLVETFDNTIDEFKKRDVKLVVITGDVFDSKHPSSSQLNAFSKCVQRAIKEKMEIAIVVGNHDQQRAISTTTVDIFEVLEIPEISVYAHAGSKIIKDEDGQEFGLIFLPYRDRRMIGEKTNTDAIAVIKKNLNDICASLPQKRIVVGHFMVDKPVSGENPDSFSINELVLPIDTFDCVDLVVMGHVHRHSIVSNKKPKIINIGSMDRVSFGEKDHTKVSLVIDTKTLETEIIKSKVRNFIEISLDYSPKDKYYKNQINDKIIADIDKFNAQTNLSGSILKFSVKVRPDDLCFVDNEKILSSLAAKNVKYIMPIHVAASNPRQMRNKKITEDIKCQDAMLAYINGLIEPENIKKKLIKIATHIIDEVDSK